MQPGNTEPATRSPTSRTPFRGRSSRPQSRRFRPRHRDDAVLTNLALHEYAIALALRPIATPDEARNVVDVSYIDLMGIPLRVMVSYVHIYQALFVTVDFGYALGVIRPDFGVIIQS